MLETLLQHYILSSLSILLIIAILVILGESIYSIGPTQVGLVPKRFGDKLPSDNPVAHGLVDGARAAIDLVRESKKASPESPASNPA